LLLQSLARFGQQPRILHRNDRLRREVLEQCQFCDGKRANFEAAGDDLPKQIVIFAQRHIDDGTDATEFGAQSGDPIVDRGHIGAMSNPRSIDQLAAWVVGPRDVALP
jgi:hypothetical protein